MVTNPPTPSIFKKSFLLILKSSFLKLKKINKAINAINILYHTRCKALNDMSLPKIPVRPNISTITCNDNSLYFLSMLYIN